MKESIEIVTGNILENEPPLSLDESFSFCQIPEEMVIKFIEYGIINPSEGNSPPKWKFQRSVEI